MKVYVSSITGFPEAMESMYMSKRTWTPELMKEIHDVCHAVEFHNASEEQTTKFNEMLGKVLKIGRRHITLLRFIDIAMTVEGQHYAGVADIDSHSMRFNNRIIRSSTRLADFAQDEFSNYYRDKVMSAEAMAEVLGVVFPDEITVENNKWIKSPGGYIKAGYEADRDVKRGLYPLGIPSNFVAKINLTEWAHVFRMRNMDGGANPEVKEWAESVMEQTTKKYPQITRDYVLSIEN